MSSFFPDCHTRRPRLPLIDIFIQQQPLSATFDKIVQVTALYDNWSDFQHHRAVSSEQWAQHTVQAIAFDLLGKLRICNDFVFSQSSTPGSPALSGIHNRIVMSFTSPGSDDNTRLTSIMNYAYGVMIFPHISDYLTHTHFSQYATAGHYQESVAMLLDPSTWTGLSLSNYNIWAGQIWHILVLRASRRSALRNMSSSRSESHFFWFFLEAKAGCTQSF